MVQGFVEQSGGHAKVESTPGAGTSFRLYFPIAAAPSNRDAELSRGRRPVDDGRSPHVLVVDDEALLRRVISRTLEGAGFRVSTAACGEEALAAQRRVGPFDLLLCDVVQLPQTGPEVAARLREQQPDLPVLYMADDTADALTDRSPTAGPFHLIDKPFAPATRVGRVRAALGVRVPAPVEQPSA